MSSLTRVLNSLPEPLNSRYEVVNILGVGSYAVVYQVRDRRTHEEFALKMVEKEPMRVRLLLQQLENEVAIAEEVSGTPYIVQTLETTETHTHFFIRSELCRSNLMEECDNDGPMTEEEALSWLKQACLGVQALHANGIIHRDLKPANFLVDTRGSLCICDFGFVCRTTEGLNGMVGSPGYTPPEAKNGGPKHTKKMDIYALGACLQHFLLGRIPKSRGEMPEGVSAPTQDLIEQMMSPNPKHRPSIDDVLVKLKGSLLTQLVDNWQIMVQRFSGA